MARRKIVWTDLAVSSFEDVLDFYIIRNGNKSYSNKLNKNVKKLISHLKENPLFGMITNFENVRALIFENYKIFYEVGKDMIYIDFIWDNRRNPDDLEKFL